MFTFVNEIRKQTKGGLTGLKLTATEDNRKSTAKSSTNASASGVAGNTVDGNANVGHFSPSQQNDPSWWRVDLGSSGLVPVSEIYMVNGFGGSSSVPRSNHKMAWNPGSEL